MSAQFPVARPRRLRRTPAMRRLVAETRLHARPTSSCRMFVKEGISEPQPITSMPGVVQHTRDTLRKAAHEAAEAGVGGLILFGIPAVKDGRGSGADDPAGIVQKALRDLSAEVGDATVLMADLCLDEYTDHGHCGILTPSGEVDNDATLERYASIAVAQAEAGADVVAPSGMMDGQVAAIRAALDQAGYTGDRDPGLRGEVRLGLLRPVPRGRRVRAAVRRPVGLPAGPGRTPRSPCARSRLDLDEGADMVMVKPAMTYLDIVRRVRDAVGVPVAAYQVSGEYAMVEAAAAQGWVDRDRIIDETLTSIRRAGADIILTYWATEVARSLTR